MDIEVRTTLDVRKALDAKAAAKRDVQDKVLRLEKAIQDDQPRSGGCFGWLFRQRSRKPSAALDQAVFGHKSNASSSASDRLTTAANSMEAHAESLGERAAAARAKAKALMASGKKPEALAWLKKAKQAESQHSNAVATHAALERQIDVLAESALQKEVATALSASVAVAKKKTVGLLSKAEDAVDSAVELKDFAEDVSQAFGGLQTDNYDDDELLEELQAMSMDEEIEEAVEAPEPVVAVPVVDAGAYPAAPSTKKLERKSLLADDGAAEGRAESL
jgi:tetratricopeptide (TPR) repeat protein